MTMTVTLTVTLTQDATPCRRTEREAGRSVRSEPVFFLLLPCGLRHSLFQHLILNFSSFLHLLHSARFTLLALPLRHFFSCASFLPHLLPKIINFDLIISNKLLTESSAA